MPLVKRTSSSATALLLCTVVAISGTTRQTENISSTCALNCKVPPGKTEAKCTLPADPQNLNCSRQDYANILLNVSSLDLSDNKLTVVPIWIFPYCKSLTELSLARNNIKDIEPKAFASLSDLKFLNLSFNDLRVWEVNPVNELQGLNYLDVTDNQHWLPSEQLLQLSNLTTVKGVRLSRHCQDCSLCKMPGDSDEVKNSCSRGHWRSSPSGWVWHDGIQYGRALDFIELGYWPTCLSDYACYIDQYELPCTKALYDVTTKASFALYATGSVALLVNIAVVVFIVFKKSLRADLALRLVLNIALCDVLIGLVTVLQARFNSPKTITEYFVAQQQGNHDDFNSKSEKLASIMGPILTCAVASHVFGSFVSMLDKFLKIVFAMKHDVRLGRKTALLSLLFSWSLSIAFAILPVFGVGQMTYTDFFGSTPLPSDELTITYGETKQQVGFATVSQIALVSLQLTSFVLYLPIFIVAKRSGADVGIKREAAIARKIALLVLTNLIFFTVPVVVGVFQAGIWFDTFNDTREDWRSRTLGEIQWLLFVVEILPVLCLSMNSVLNPFLYALGHPKIKQRLDPLLSRCRTTMSECSTTLRQNFRCHSTPVEPTNNEVEMQQVRIIQSPSHTNGQNNEVKIHDTRL